MGFLNQLAEQRLTGGPAGLGAYDPIVQRKMTAIEKMTRQEQRYIDALTLDPDLSSENPDAAQALADYQIANTYGTPDARLHAQESLWRKLVTAPGVQHTLSAVAWVGRQFERGDRALATFLRGAVDSVSLDIQARASFLPSEDYQQVRRVLRAFDEVPEDAAAMMERLSPSARRLIESIPPEYRAVLGMNPWERLVAGLSLDPEALTIGEALISDDAAERPIGIFGLKAGHLRLPADISFSPLTWLSGSGAATKSLGRILARADDPALALAKVRASGIRVPVGTRASGVRGRVLTEKGLEAWTKTYRRTYEVAKARREQYLRVRGITFPGKTEQAQAITEEATRYANDIALRGAAERVGRLLESQSGLLDRGGLYFAPPFITPIPLVSGAQITAPGRFIYAQIAKHSPGLKNVGDRVVDFFDKALNELPYNARKNFGYATLKAQYRANAKRGFATLSADIKDHFGQIPTDQAEAIGHYLNIRDSTRIRTEDPAQILKALEAINPEYRSSIPDLISTHYTSPFASVEGELRVLDRVRDVYFPQRYKNHEEMSLALRHAILSDPQKAPAIAARIAPEQGFAMERVFDDYIEAKAVAKLYGIDLEPVLDFRQALVIRAREHVTAVEAARLEQSVVRRFGRSEEEVNRLAFRTVFPEWEEAVEREVAVHGEIPTQGDIRRVTAIGLPVKLFDDLLSYGIRSEGKNARELRNSIGRHLGGMDDTERAIWTLGAMRQLGARGDLKGLDDFFTTYASTIESITGKSIRAARMDIQRTKQIELGEHITDRFGQKWALVGDGPMEGHYVPMGIYRDIREHAVPNLSKPIRDALRTTDLMTDFVKFGLTAPWPAFHVRNAYSNVAQGFLEIGWSAFNPRTWRHATNILRGKDGAMEIGGKMAPYSALRKEAEIYGVIQPAGTTLDYIDAEGAFRKTLSGSAGSKVGQWVENDARTMLYTHYRGQGIAPEHASAAVNKVFADYGSLSGLDQSIMKRFFPFWVWNKKNIAFQADRARREPGRWSAMVRTMQSAITVDDEGGVDEAFLPEYALGTLRIGLGGNETTARFLTGIDLPVDSALELAWPIDVQQSVRAWVSMIHPARSILDAYGWQKDPFTGQELGRDGRAVLNGMGTVIETLRDALGPLGEKFADLMEYKTLVDEETGDVFRTVNAAKYHVFIKGSFLARMAGTTDRYQKYLEREGPEVSALILDALGGVRLHEYDLTDRQRTLIQKNLRMLETLGIQRDRIYQFPVHGISRRTEM